MTCGDCAFYRYASGAGPHDCAFVRHGRRRYQGTCFVEPRPVGREHKDPPCRHFVAKPRDHGQIDAICPYCDVHMTIYPNGNTHKA